MPAPSLRLAVVRLLALALSMAVGAVACQSAGPTASYSLRTLNGSGVSGTVTLTSQGDQTEVRIEVDPAGNLDMPAHIHPGTCDDLVPQPKFPLENVRDGASMTVVPASLVELTTGSLAVNIHRSNADMSTYTACVELR